RRSSFASVGSLGFGVWAGRGTFGAHHVYPRHRGRRGASPEETPGTSPRLERVSQVPSDSHAESRDKVREKIPSARQLVRGKRKSAQDRETICKRSPVGARVWVRSGARASPSGSSTPGSDCLAALAASKAVATARTNWRALTRDLAPPFGLMVISEDARKGAEFPIGPKEPKIESGMGFLMAKGRAISLDQLHG